jgi:type II secretory pathway pseudopilin PulG
MTMCVAATIMEEPTGRCGTNRGITLLEVLIACGLLIIGLSAMASLLPAAGARLAQASLADRAGVLASNAFADATSRGLIAADAFPAAAASDPQAVRALAIGAIVGQLPGYGVLPSGHRTDDSFTGPTDAVLKRCISPRAFMLEDEIVYGPPALGSAPVNAFAATADGSLGPRQVRDGVCWGATLAPNLFPPARGGAAVLAIAVFRRGGAVVPGEMKAATPVVLTRTDSFYEADITQGGGLLRACEWILAMPSSPTTAPRWFQIMSSWTFEPPEPQTPRLIFRNQPEFQSLTGASSNGSKATVFAFEGLVRVDEHLVTLN